VASVLADPLLKQRSEATGSYPIACTPEEFSAFIRKEAQRWLRVIRDADIRLE